MLIKNKKKTSMRKAISPFQQLSINLWYLSKDWKYSGSFS